MLDAPLNFRPMVMFFFCVGVEGMSHFPNWQREGGGEVYRGTHYLVVSRKQGAMKAVRGLMDEVSIRPANRFRYPLP